MATKSETPGPKTSIEALTKYSFPPIVASDAKILILGTLPGEESLRLQQYYGHTRNHFWPAIAAVVNEPPPTLYSERVAMLLRNRIALWDVLECAERTGSALDSAIESERANDFAEFFRQHPMIRTVAFNGNNAHKFFKRLVGKIQDLPPELVLLPPLPSTSPAYARPFEEKVAKWRAALAGY
jgi:double-stranded uracil-DNA glycosylase